MFLKGFECNITDYANNKMPYLSDFNLGTTFKNNRKLQQFLFFRFFEEDFIKYNPDECHFLEKIDDSIFIKLKAFDIVLCIM